MLNKLFKTVTNLLKPIIDKRLDDGFPLPTAQIANISFSDSSVTEEEFYLKIMTSPKFNPSIPQEEQLHQKSFPAKRVLSEEVIETEEEKKKREQDELFKQILEHPIFSALIPTEEQLKVMQKQAGLRNRQFF